MDRTKHGNNMAVISHGQSALIATFSAEGDSDADLKKMDFVVPVGRVIDSVIAPTSGTNYTQDPIYLWKASAHANSGANYRMGAIKLGIHATGSYNSGQEYKEFVYFKHFNGGAIATLSTQTGDNSSTFNNAGNFSLAIQTASSDTLRITQNKDYRTANEVKVYYLGGGCDVTFVGRNSGQASGLGSVGADYDDRWYQSFWIV